MTTSTLLLIFIWLTVLIEVIIILTQTSKKPQLNNPPAFNYPSEEVYFEIIKIESISYISCEYITSKYTAVICFFKKPNNRKFVYDEYVFYDKKDKYNIGDKLYLNKKS